ncbi:nitroreductase family protein [Thalassotalea crassostreae]|uniref:nitroreductase family protein n=1 Tax=Thalassotalea crassostreae TaxID=1763536 RepID=UPI000838F23D|nr:nitroreductase family protein [Thalassotalea crassostreae]
MTNIEFLLNRQSNGFLQLPSPNSDELNNILQSGVAAPDHANLNPYEFIVVQGSGLDTLTDFYVESISATTDDDFKLEKAKKMAYRAPITIIVATNYKEHPKVPKHEQMITAGCAVQAMQMAAVAQGYQAMWRTGDITESSIMKSRLGISEGNDIVGFLYVGSASKVLPQKPRKPANNFVRYLK